LDLPGVLSGEQIRARILSDAPLIEAFLDLDGQTQPNGFDLTLAEIHRYLGPGTVAKSNANRVLPDLEPIPLDENGYFTLDPGTYHIVYNEIVRFPMDLMALGRPRSTLNRSGVTINTAVWDCGYHGRSTSMLVVANPFGFRIEAGARLMQLVFFGLSRPAESGYQGIYQGENIARG
jgi:dUTP pyrophosphatase